MDRDLNKLRRDLDPEDRRGADALARARLRAQAPEASALLELTRTALDHLAARAPGSGNAAGIADLILASDPGRLLTPARRAVLERLRPFFGAARAPDAAPEWLSLLFLDPPHERFEVFEEFFEYAQEFGGNSGGYAWRYQLLPLPEARGLEDVEAVARLLLTHPASLTCRRMPVLDDAAARSAQGIPGALPNFPGFPEGLEAVLKGLLTLFIGDEWQLFDPGINTQRTTRCSYELLRFGDDWYGLEQFFD